MRITVDDVREACARLPEPRQHAIYEMDETRAASILVPVVDLDGEAAIIATKRHGDMRSHGDDWVFPGGRVEPGDASACEAARREAAEELGIPLDRIDVVGQLDTHGPIVSGFVVDVFVAVVEADTLLAPDASEVSDIAVVPLATLLAPGRSFMATIAADFDPGEIVVSARQVIRPEAALRWYELVPGQHLWGMQGNILYNLLHHITGGAHVLGDGAGAPDGS